MHVHLCAYVCMCECTLTFFVFLYQDDYLASMTFGSRTLEMFLPQPHVSLADTKLHQRDCFSLIYTIQNPLSLGTSP